MGVVEGGRGRGPGYGGRSGVSGLACERRGKREIKRGKSCMTTREEEASDVL